MHMQSTQNYTILCFHPCHCRSNKTMNEFSFKSAHSVSGILQFAIFCALFSTCFNISSSKSRCFQQVISNNGQILQITSYFCMPRITASIYGLCEMARHVSHWLLTFIPRIACTEHIKIPMKQLHFRYTKKSVSLVRYNSRLHFRHLLF